MFYDTAYCHAFAEIWQKRLADDGGKQHIMSYYGYSAIPERWLAAVNDREKLDKLINDFIEICGK